MSDRPVKMRSRSSLSVGGFVKPIEAIRDELSLKQRKRSERGPINLVPLNGPELSDLRLVPTLEIKSDAGVDRVIGVNEKAANAKGDGLCIVGPVSEFVFVNWGPRS